MHWEETAARFAGAKAVGVVGGAGKGTPRVWGCGGGLWEMLCSALASGPPSSPQNKAPGVGAGGRACGSPLFMALCLGFPICAVEATSTARDRSMRRRLEGKRQAPDTRQPASV